MKPWERYCLIRLSQKNREREEEAERESKLRELQEWNEKYYYLREHEKTLNDYIESVHAIHADYSFDPACIDNGYYLAEIERMDRVKELISEYVSLGGDPYEIKDSDKEDFPYRMRKQIKLLKMLEEKVRGGKGDEEEKADFIELYHFQCTDELIDLMEEYIDLGGAWIYMADPIRREDGLDAFLLTSDKVRRNIRKIQYLKEKGMLDEQDNYMQKTLEEIKEELE